MHISNGSMKVMVNIRKFSRAELINSFVNTVWVYRYINMIPWLQMAHWMKPKDSWIIAAWRHQYTEHLPHWYLLFTQVSYHCLKFTAYKNTLEKINDIWSLYIIVLWMILYHISLGLNDVLVKRKCPSKLEGSDFLSSPWFSYTGNTWVSYQSGPSKP